LDDVIPDDGNWAKYKNGVAEAIPFFIEIFIKYPSELKR
jgi:hypothetical protein